MKNQSPQNELPNLDQQFLLLKRSFPVAVMAFAIVLLLVLHFRIRQQLIDLQKSIPQVQSEARENLLAVIEDRTDAETAEKLRRASPNQILRPDLPANPVYVFRKNFVEWSELTIHEPSVVQEPISVQFFATPCQPHTRLEMVRANSRGLQFQQPGAYPLLTPLGAFRILILSETVTADEEILQITRWVSRNTVHTQANENLAYLWDNGEVVGSSPRRLASVFSTSSQPLKLHCGAVSTYLRWMLHQQGFRSQQVGLTRNDGAGHTAIQAYFPNQQLWVFLDPDFGAMPCDAESDRPLSITEIATRLKNDQPDSLRLVNFGPEPALQTQYNPGSAKYEFTWSPACSDPQRQVLDPQWYLEMLTEYTHDVNVLPEGE